MPLGRDICLDEKDLPAGTCVSRAEWRQRDCESEGKPSDCHDVADRRLEDEVAERMARPQVVTELVVKVSKPKRALPAAGSNDADDNGFSTLDMDSIYNVYSHYGANLGGCLQRTGVGSAKIGIIVNGPSGRVTLVKVDGKQDGATWACLNGVLRGMKFPSIKGTHTRADFDIAL